MLRMFTVILVTILVVTGCASSQEVGKKPPAPTNAVSEYEIGVGDQLNVLVWKSPELSTTVPVRPDGKITVPLVGDVMAAGESAEQLSGQIASSLEAFVRNPQVTVSVVNPASADYLARVRVTGAVAKPLSLPHRQGMTVLDLVLQAGGLNEYAKGNQAKLYRKAGDKVEVFPVNLDDILNKGIIETNYTLAPSDILTVPERSL